MSNIQETLEGLKKRREFHSHDSIPCYVGEEKEGCVLCQENKVLNEAINWGEILEQAEGELGEKGTCPFCQCNGSNNCGDCEYQYGSNQMHDIARPILAKAILENKEKDKRIEELHNEILELKGVTYD